MNELGVVIIGRNEGERLRQCLNSVVGRDRPVIYVDSGSTDGSVELARALGAEVVELDMSRPFTAGRARNAGFARLEQIAPAVSVVQFVDGDCEVRDGWLERGRATLEDRPDVAVVFGRCRERFVERSIYNQLADIEFHTPVGEAKHCGGNAMMRAATFRQAGGFNPSLIAGEEPELCVRLRQQGWKVFHVDAEMVLHDMAMTRFGQWWKRCERSGFAFAQGTAMHGKPPERHWTHHVRSTLFWGIAWPMVILGLAWPTRGASLVLALFYPLQVFRVARHFQKAGHPRRLAWLYSGACVLGRFPNARGAMRYWYGRLVGRQQSLIEYKGRPAAPTSFPR